MAKNNLEPLRKSDFPPEVPEIPQGSPEFPPSANDDEIVPLLPKSFAQVAEEVRTNTNIVKANILFADWVKEANPSPEALLNEVATALQATGERRDAAEFRAALAASLYQRFGDTTKRGWPVQQIQYAMVAAMDIRRGSGIRNPEEARKRLLEMARYEGIKEELALLLAGIDEVS